LATIGAPSEAGTPKGRAERCGACRFFTGAPAALERAIPGLNILSSAYGSVRDNTGLCERHEAFVTSGTVSCPDFVTG
jgi:hypothetical protein